MHLIPTPEEALSLMREAGALRIGHFAYGDLHSDQHLEVSLALRNHRLAKTLTVGLSRLLRANTDVRPLIPQLSMVAATVAGQGMSLKGAKVVVQGFGNAGGIAARLFHEDGAKVIAVSDSKGGVYNERGIDPEAILKFKGDTGSVVGFKGCDHVTNHELLELRCDVLVPAALENTITMENAEHIRAKIVAEAANGPTTPGADQILRERGIFVIPDILCNAGGVTVSYFEWVQDLYSFFWPEQEVNKYLERTMNSAFKEVHAAAEQYRVDMRTGAYITAVARVAEATRVRGIFP